MSTERMRVNSPGHDLSGSQAPEPNARIRQNFEKVESIAVKLEALGLDVNAENSEALRLQYETRQVPTDVPDIAAALEGGPANVDAHRLGMLMREANISSIMHAEGLTVGDHVVAVMAAADAIPNLSDEDRHDLRILVLYHDRGKTEVATSDKNLAQSEKQRANGKLSVSMIGHANPAELTQTWPKIKTAFAANGVSDEYVPRFLKVVEIHMDFLVRFTPEFLAKIVPSQADQRDIKAVKQLYDFVHNLAPTDDERQWILAKVNLLEHADGAGTLEVVLGPSGAAEFTAKPISPDAVQTGALLWERYQEECRAFERADLEKAMIAEVLDGQSIGDYLAAHGIPRGPEMRIAQKRVKALVATFIDEEAKVLSVDRVEALARLRVQLDQTVSS